MPKASLTAGAHRDDASVDRFDELKLDTGEVARIWIPDEGAAWMEWVHLLTLPVFEENGAPEMTEKTVRKMVRTVIENTFLGSPICLGADEVVAEQGLDPDRCPACAGIKKMLDAGVTYADDMRPQRRFAIPVIRYNTSSKKSTQLMNPPGGRIVVWRLSQWTYRKLDDSRTKIVDLLELEGGVEKTNFKLVDLSVQCESAAFGQKIGDISALRPAWRNPEVKELVRVLWTTPENHPSEAQLKAACGRDSGREWMKRDIEDAEEAWTRAVHWGDNGPLDSSKTNRMSGGGANGHRPLDEALDSLLGEGPPSDPLADHPGGLAEFGGQAAQAPDDDLFGPAASAPPASAPAASWPSDDDLFGSAPAAAAPAAAAPAAAPAAAAPPVTTTPVATTPAVPGDDLFAEAGNSAATALGDGPKVPAAAAAKVASFEDIMPTDVPA